MDRCAMQFIARRWWRRAEVWAIAVLLLAGGSILGFQAAQWSMAASYMEQVTQVRKAYDEALAQRDLRLTKLAQSATEAAGKVEEAAESASKAAATANKAVDKANEAVDRAKQ
jgi:predicted negative regulator of RcsB-dependent stress response